MILNSVMEDCNVRTQQQPVYLAVDQAQEKAAVLARTVRLQKKGLPTRVPKWELAATSAGENA